MESELVVAHLSISKGVLYHGVFYMRNGDALLRERLVEGNEPVHFRSPARAICKQDGAVLGVGPDLEENSVAGAAAEVVAQLHVDMQLFQDAVAAERADSVIVFRKLFEQIDGAVLDIEVVAGAIFTPALSVSAEGLTQLCHIGIYVLYAVR